MYNLILMCYTGVAGFCPTKLSEFVLHSKFWNLSYKFPKVGICPTPILEFVLLLLLEYVLQITNDWNLSYSYFGTCPTTIDHWGNCNKSVNFQ